MLICHVTIASVLLFIAASLSAQTGGVGSAPADFTPVGDQVFFTAATPKLGRELWRTDGTTSGTWLVRDLTQGPSSSVMSQFLAGDRVVYFRRQSGGAWDVWKSDGTNDGTTMLWSGPNEPRLLGVTRNGLLFVVDFQHHWVADGSDAQTREIRALLGLPFGNTVIVDGVAWFAPQRGSDHGIWRSDGTKEGTRLVHPYGEPGNVNGTFITALDSVYFVGDSTEELLRVFPAEPATVLEKLDGGSVFGKAVIGGALYIAVINNRSTHFFDASLWKTDGVHARTASAVNLGDMAFPMNLIAAGESLFYDRETHQRTHQLWVTLGRSEGLELNPTLEVGNARATLGTLLLFDAYPLKSPARFPEMELYRSDGTPNGTVLVRDIAPGIDPVTGAPASSDPQGLTAWRDMVLFSANDHVNGQELWRTDGTAAGTRLVANIAVESGIEGRITDGRTGAPLAGVIVEAHASLFGAPRLVMSATSDANGRYRINGLPPGTYKIRTRNVADYLDEVWLHVPCPPCELLQGASVEVPGETLLTGFDFGLVEPGPTPKRRAS
jgi:ELWxxDGT repeat protein